MTRFSLYVLTSLMLLTLAGCEEDELAKAVREAAEQSAEQQRKLVQLQSEVAKSASELVEADSKARTELAALQRDLQQDQAGLGASDGLGRLIAKAHSDFLPAVRPTPKSQSACRAEAPWDS